MAIRDNDLAASVMGISLFRYKLLAFFIGCAYAGIAGVIYTYWWGAITPEPFTLMESVWYLGMIIVGGLGSVFGSVAGAVLITFLSEYTTYFFSLLAGVWPGVVSVMMPMRGVLFGLIIILFLIFEPRGLAHRWGLVKVYYRLWPFSY